MKTIIKTFCKRIESGKFNFENVMEKKKLLWSRMQRNAIVL